jgi:hypothetical protein
MARRTTFRTRLAQTLVVVTAVATLAVPVASAGAGTGSGEHDGWYRYAVSPTRASTPNPWLDYVRSLTADAAGQTFVADTLAPGGGGGSEPSGYRFVVDTLAPGGGLPAAVGAGSSFHWSDAGAGAGVAAGVLLVLLGSALLAARRRTRVAT